ncbi:hypothetical protein CDV36_015527 [Fusarium kuroshium]|uniref:Uncharacterized protein n=2 Tax=Fusarium solani species complex TaxID=232080 RepID=A0A3M2RAC3_9HYPO|nr:hypothetical protein CDV36_015527 [Fusarium kuroshium]RSL40847.1 hypothetical protein CEP51_016646 [Fusarium floridanum]
MPLSTVLSGLRGCREGRHVRSPVPATTGGSLDKYPKAPSLPTASLCSKTTLDESAVNLPSETFECSEEGWPDAQPRLVPSLAATPTNSFRHSLDDGEKIAPEGSAFAVDKLNEKFARIVRRAEINHKQPAPQQQPFIRASHRIWSLIRRLLCHPHPDDAPDICDRSLKDSASFRATQDAPRVHALACHLCPDGNSNTQDGPAEPLSFHLAQCLDILGNPVSPEAIQSGLVRADKLLLKKIEKRHRQPVSFFLPNCNGSSGRQDDTGTDEDTDTDPDTDTAIGTSIGSDTSVEDEIDTCSSIIDDIDADETCTDDD